MTKKDLVDHIAEECDMTKAGAERVVVTIVDTIFDTLKKGGEVSIAGFGVFSTSQRAAREARNPRTGETIHVKATRAPKFKAGKALKEAVKT